MSPSIGVNLRVTGHCNQGGRKYMEDVFSVAYQQTEDERDLEFAFFGIFDGHGGREAALFAKEYLMDSITAQRNFWSDDDELVLKSIREGFLTTQQAMWEDRPNWKPTASGLPSTAGTTASICFIKRGKLFIGHCGDSGIVLGEKDPHNPGRWRARPLTVDHKPESDVELARIEASGGKVVEKSGVPRVVWHRPRANHQGPVRRSTLIDEVPFLAVARALGDLWSYNAKKDVYVVSPDPDLHVYDLDILRDRCLILATDGAWNVISPDMAVESVYKAEKNNEKQMILSSDAAANGYTWINPSKSLVDYALDRWQLCRLRADNTSIVTVMLDPPGPPRAQVLRKLHSATLPPEIPVSSKSKKPPTLPPKPHKGIAIISRFPNSKRDEEKEGTNLVVNNSEDDNANSKVVEASPVRSSPTAATRIVHDSTKSAPQKLKVRSTSVPTVSSAKPILSDPLHPAPSTTSNDLAALERLCTNASNVQHTSKPPTAAAAASASSSSGRNNIKKQSDLIKDSNIVKNSISSRSSSNCENKSPSPPPLPERQSKRKTSHSSRQSAQQQQQLPPHQPVRPPKHKSSSSGEAPIIPVKQPRRSVCPDNNVDYNSDAENQERPRRSTRSSHSGGVTTGSVAVASAPSATRSQKAVVTNLKSLASTSGAPNSSRRSMPLLKSSATSSSPSSSGQGDLASNKNSSSNTNDNHGSNARVLRSRNTVAELDSAGEDVSGGVKRKRRTLEATSKKHSRSCSWNPASVATANSAKKARVLRNK